MEVEAVLLMLTCAPVLGLSVWALLDIGRSNCRFTMSSVLYSFMALLPVLGPLAYFWLKKAPAKAADHLQNSGPPGRYLHDFLAIRHLYSDAIEKIREKAESHNRGAGDAFENGADGSDASDHTKQRKFK